MDDEMNLQDGDHDISEEDDELLNDQQDMHLNDFQSMSDGIVLGADSADLDQEADQLAKYDNLKMKHMIMAQKG